MKQKYVMPVVAVLVFMAIQMVVSVLMVLPVTIVNVVEQVTAGAEPTAVSPEAMMAPGLMGWVLIVSSVISIIAMQWPFKMVRLGQSFAKPREGVGTIVWLLAVAMVGVYSTDVFNEMLALPDLIGVEMSGMLHNPWGILAVGVIGPIAEEVVLRGAAQGWMHQHGVAPMRAILVAAFLFGLMHLNPAQIPFAMLMGIVLGILYWKSGSLVLACLLHILNNSMVCLLANVCGEDFSLVECLGGTASASVIATCGLAFCAWVMYRYYSRPSCSD